MGKLEVKIERRKKIEFSFNLNIFKNFYLLCKIENLPGANNGRGGSSGAA